ncbi:MAG: hypothetical protein K1Y36_10975 [Blastocatellia bacterium]|nr:hypothetical protein [Blastocatellia bacterium]
MRIRLRTLTIRGATLFIGLFLLFTSLFVCGSAASHQFSREPRRQGRLTERIHQSLAAKKGLLSGSITVGGLERTYRLYVPKAIQKQNATPLVIVLHGGGGDGKGMVTLTHFNDVAEREKFIAVYPDGLNKSWNDGREDKPGQADVDDVGFISALIDKLGTEYNVDQRRIFATGMSNGGFFSNRLGCQLSNKIAAIAPVAGAFPDFSTTPLYAPAGPLPVLLINGTDDPLVLYNGGFVAGNRGKSLSVAATVALWVKAGGCSPTPEVTLLPDTANDGTQARREVYNGCSHNAQVVLITVQNGGHTWPGGFQYLPQIIIGKTSRDFDASETIWEFFRNHPKS